MFAVVLVAFSVRSFLRVVLVSLVDYLDEIVVHSVLQKTDVSVVVVELPDIFVAALVPAESCRLVEVAVGILADSLLEVPAVE